MAARMAQAQAQSLAQVLVTPDMLGMTAGFNYYRALLRRSPFAQHRALRPIEALVIAPSQRLDDLAGRGRGQTRRGDYAAGH